MNIVVKIKDCRLKFKTNPGLFSPRSVDRGTLAMLSIVKLSDNEKVLDIGCGYGAVGIFMAKQIGDENVVMSDSDLKAVRTAGSNSVLNGVGAVRTILSDAYNEIPDMDFSLILSNPPYHTDFTVAKRIIEGGYRRLISGGKLYMVTKRKDWYKNKLISVFGGVKIHETDGYYVFMAQKK